MIKYDNDKLTKIVKSKKITCKNYKKVKELITRNLNGSISNGLETNLKK